MLEARRAEGRRRLLPGVLARARRSGQPDVQHPQRAEGGRRHRRRRRRELASLLYGAAIETHRPGQLAAGGRDGEAAREHVPRGQHRPGQRDRADVRPARHRRLGSRRRRRRPSRSGSCRSIPGPGLGGHCIPIDPFYLSWKAKQTGFEPRFIELAGQVNGAMPHFVVDKIADALNRASARRSTARRCWSSASPTSATSTTCASRRRST